MRPRCTEGTCNHFNGLANPMCDAGVAYATVAVEHEPRERRDSIGSVHKASKSYPCMDKYNLTGATCDKQQMPTAEQIAATKAEDARRYDLMKRGLSGCCEAKIDESQVIREGRYKGHGPRFCSKCGKCVFIV